MGIFSPDAGNRVNGRGAVAIGLGAVRVGVAVGVGRTNVAVDCGGDAAGDTVGVGRDGRVGPGWGGTTVLGISVGGGVGTVCRRGSWFGAAHPTGRGATAKSDKRIKPVSATGQKSSKSSSLTKLVRISIILNGKGCG